MRCDESGLSRQIKNQFLEIRVRDVKTSNILSEFKKAFNLYPLLSTKSKKSHRNDISNVLSKIHDKIFKRAKYVALTII